MKNSTLLKLLLVFVIAVFSFTTVFIQLSKQPKKNGQTVSFIVEHFFEPTEEPQSDIPDPSEDFLTAKENLPIDDGFDLPAENFDTDLWLDKIESFREKIEKAANEKGNDNVNNNNDNDNDNNNNDNAAAPSPATKHTNSVIIDTDFASDADDVVAIRLALCLHDMGMLDIRGIALSTTYSRSPLAIHALCYQDGHGDIPVAMDTSGDGIQVHTDYVDAMYEMQKSRSDFEQPVQMYRRILSESDTKVSIITLGFLQNIQALMNSQPDRYSSLTGAELIAAKVDTIYIVGGNSTGKPSFNFYWTGDKVINAARDVADHFPTRTVFLQSDLSDDTFCGQFYQTRDSNRQDIVTKALYANDQYGGVVAWDVFSVWCAAQDMNDNLEASYLELEQGNQYISPTGATQWTATDDGKHYKMYKRMQGSYYSEIMNNMLLDKFNSR